MTTPADLLALARGLVAEPEPDLAGVWPRAAALLARQSLEAAVDAVWAARGLEFETTSMRAQLICLRAYIADDAAADAAHAWSALSHACHVHAYDLPPTSGELRALFDAVERLIERTANVV